MNFRRVIYRVGQFWKVLSSHHLTENDLAPAAQVLTDQQMALFTCLQPSEQAHGLRVLQTLQNQGENHPELFTAALLHDIGKICHPLRIWERVMIVLGKQFFPKRMKKWGEADPKGWKRPFVVAAKHPLWGAELASAAGTQALALYLIREHQTDLEPGTSLLLEEDLISRLQGADDQN